MRNPSKISKIVGSEESFVVLVNKMQQKHHLSPRTRPAKVMLSFLSLSLLLALSAAPSFSSTDLNQTPEDKVLSSAFSAFMDGKDKQALTYFEEAVRINPHNEAAIKGIEKVKVRMKRKEEEQKSKAKSLARSKVKEGNQFLKTNDYIGAIDSFHAAIDAVPGDSSAESGLRSIKSKMAKEANRSGLNLTTRAMARGVLAYLDRDWAKAYRIWSERSKVEPSNAALANASARAENKFRHMMISEREEFFRRGARAFYEQGLYSESLTSWAKVLEMKGDDQEALEGKARAEEAIRRAKGTGQENKVHDLLEVGLDQYANQNWQKALQSFKDLLALDPDFSTANEYIAKINEKLSASDYHQNAVSSGGSWRHNQASNQGTAEVDLPDALENFPARKAELESQLKRDPTSIRLQQELDKLNKSRDEESERIYKDGLIAYSQGNRSQAIQKWKQVLVIDPDHKKALSALKKAKAEEERSDKGGSVEP